MGEKMQDILGTRGQIPTKTFLAAHDRGVALQCKHFMEVSFLLGFCFHGKFRFSGNLVFN